MGKEAQRLYEFGPFRLETVERTLLRDGRPVSLPPKVFDTLLLLVQRSGRLVEKDELMQKLWPDTFVEESNLTQNVFTLRRVLGEANDAHPYIETVPKRGYRFVADVRELELEPADLIIEKRTRARIITDEAGTGALPSGTLPVDIINRCPNNLPGQLTPLIGRKAELAEIESLLQQSDLRLLTLTGAGGSGKTRLGLQVATDLLQDFTDGVFFVPLAPITEPDLVVSAIAQTLGIKEATGTPLIEAVKRQLRDKQMLLLLDNFERLLVAAPLVTELLAACHQLKVIVTSRAVLHLRGEHEFAVQPLALPDPAHSQSIEALSQCEAVALFVERARAVRPDFEINGENVGVVADVCIRLDGLPLAIELAAARIKLLSPPAMLARLEHRLKLLVGGARDLPARQQTMRDTIAWSYDLLDEEGKRLFRRVAVFVGGLSLEAAEAVGNPAGEPKIDILESLASLVDKSLLGQKEQAGGEPRFMMLETFREYGLEQLETWGETTNVRRLHANFFLELMEQAEPKLSAADQGVWLDRLETEHGNLRAALRWAKENGEVLIGSQIAGALGRFWLMRGHYSEGRERLAEFLSFAGGSAPTELRTKLLTGAGILAQNQGDYSAARCFFEESLAIWREIGNKEGIAASLTNLGWVAWRQSDYQAARSLSEEGLALNRELDNQQGIAHSLNNLGFVAHHQGDYSAARSFHEESLALRGELGDKRGIAFAKTNLGWAMQKLGDYELAAALLEEARVLFKQLGDKQLLAYSSNILAGVVHDQGNDRHATALIEESVNTCRDIGAKYSLAVGLRILGDVTHEQGDHQRAAALMNESLKTFREIGDRYGAAFALCSLANISLDQGDDDRATSLLRESLTLRNEIGDKHGVVDCLDSLAAVAIAQSQLERALQLAGAAEALRAALAVPLSPSEQFRSDRNRQWARGALDDKAFASAHEQGCAMTLEGAVAFALARG